MPTYEYECLHCNHRFETFQRMMDEPLESCPKCGKRVRRLIHGGMGVIFKGSGFYSTDNRNGGTNGSKKETAEPASASTKSAGDSAGSKESPSAANKEPSKKEPSKKEG